MAKRFDVKFKFDANVDTVGVMLPYADFRVRPYSLEQTLDNIYKYYDWNWWKQSGNSYKIKLYEYPRRHEDEGQQMLEWLSQKYSNAEQWEQRRSVLFKEVRERLEIDAFLDSCVKDVPAILSKVKKLDGFSTQNICLELTPGQHVFGSSASLRWPVWVLSALTSTSTATDSRPTKWATITPPVLTSFRPPAG